MRESILNYAQTHNLPVREETMCYVITVVKNNLRFKVKVLKFDDALEWFIEVKATDTDGEVFRDHLEVYALNQRSQPELVAQLETDVVHFLEQIRAYAVRIGTNLPAGFIGRLVGASKRIETGWRSIFE